MAQQHEQHHDHSLLAELACIFDDHEPANHAAPAIHPMHQQSGMPISTSVSKSADSPASDPFLLPGDEQTWDLDDWAWDSYNLSAVPKDDQPHAQQLAGVATACCQALKKRKVPTTACDNQVTVPPAPHRANHCAYPAKLQDSTVITTGSTQGAADNPTHMLANGCCNFQLPAHHMPAVNPSTAVPNLQPHTPPPHASMQPEPLTYSQVFGPQMRQNASAVPWNAAFAASMGAHPGMYMPLHPAASMLPHPMVASQPPLHQQPCQPDPVNTFLQAAAMPAVAHTPEATSQNSAWSQLMPPALTAPPPQAASHAAATPVTGPIPRSSNCGVPQVGSGRPSAAECVTPGVPQVADHVDECDSEADGDNSGSNKHVGNSSGLGEDTANNKKRGVALQPATYTGSLEDVVSLSDRFDEGCKMQCQVAGCGRDLTQLKDYHQRYRICEVHIKLPQVLRGGRLQRFCQQCGRFHDLAAFDAGRKSCREQLSKHNARRRRRAQIESQKVKAAEQLAGSSVIAQALTAATTEIVNSSTAAGAAPPNNDPPGDHHSDLMGGAGDVSRLLAALIQNPQQLHALRLLLGVQTHPALPPMQPFIPETTAPTLNGAANSAVDGGNANVPSVADPPGYALARDIVDGKGMWAPNFESDHQALRISMKLFNRTPADLPHDLKGQLASWLSSMPAAISGAIRPGCVFLTLHLLVDKHTHQDALQRGLASLLRHLQSNGCQFWHEGVYTVQLGCEMAMVAGGNVTAYYHDHKNDTHGPKEQIPVVAGLPADGPACQSSKNGQYPVVTVVDSLCVVADRNTTAHIQLRGVFLNQKGIELIIRQENLQLKIKLVPADSNPKNQLNKEQVFTADIPMANGTNGKGLQEGLAWIEVSRGAWLSPAHPILVLDDATLASEIQQLTETSCRAQLEQNDLSALLIDAGIVLAHAADAKFRDGFNVNDHGIVSLKARRLLLFACDMGWAAMAARVLPLATSNCSCASEVVAAVHASSTLPKPQLQNCEYGSLLSTAATDCSAVGLSLLHRVVRSGSLSLLQGVLHWGAVAGYPWRADRTGPAGITPLHLAALQEDPRILLALLEHVPEGAFTALTAHDGTTPFHLAFQMGHFALDNLTQLLSKEVLLPASDSKALLEAVANRRKGRHAAAKEQPARDGVMKPPAETVLHSTGADLDPCSKCHCTLPPMMLSIAASCAECGEHVPCLGSLSSKADVSNGVSSSPAVGHDSSHCAGCTQPAKASPATAHHQCNTLPKEEEHEINASMLAPSQNNNTAWSADCANNCIGIDSNNNSVLGRRSHAGNSKDLHASKRMRIGYRSVGCSSASGYVDVACSHHHGSVFNVTALCQGCHTNRILRVV